MTKTEQFLEDVDDLANRVYDLPIPSKVKDRVAELIDEINHALEEQNTLRSTEWG